jgi:hypothetical protein
MSKSYAVTTSADDHIAGLLIGDSSERLRTGDTASSLDSGWGFL